MINIRELRHDDVEEIGKIEAACFSMPWSVKALSDVVDDENSLYLVAEADGVLAGLAGATNAAGEGNVNNVAVAEPFRGKGIATALMQELLRRGAERGMEAFTLEVRVSNAPAVHLYEKLGFVSEGIRPGFYEKPTEDAYIMWRR